MPATANIWPAGDTRSVARIEALGDAPWSHGSTTEWPPELKFATMFVFDSIAPTALLWGDDCSTIGNDAFIQLLSADDVAIGSSPGAVWGSAWETICPVVRRALAGSAACIANVPITREADGTLTARSLEIAFTPVRRADGGVAGVLATVTDETVRRAVTARAREDGDLYARRWNAR